MFQGTPALAVFWSHSDLCRGLSSSQLSGSLYKSTLGGSPSGKVGQTNFRISSRDSRLRRVDIFRSHWSAWSARNRRIREETKVLTQPESVHHISGTLSASLVIPPHSGAEQADGEAGDDQQRAHCRHRWREDQRREAEVSFVHQHSWGLNTDL